MGRSGIRRISTPIPLFPSVVHADLCRSADIIVLQRAETTIANIQGLAAIAVDDVVGHLRVCAAPDSDAVFPVAVHLCVRACRRGDQIEAILIVFEANTIQQTVYRRTQVAITSASAKQLGSQLCQLCLCTFESSKTKPKQVSSAQTTM